MDFDAKEFLVGLFAPPVELCPDDLPGDWRVWFEERAAIMEYHGGLPKERAEAEAMREVTRRMRTGQQAMFPVEKSEKEKLLS